MANIGKTEPAYDMAAVTASNTADINPTRGVYIGGAGDLKVDTAGQRYQSLLGWRGINDLNLNFVALLSVHWPVRMIRKDFD